MNFGQETRKINLFAVPLTFKVKFCNPVTVVVCGHLLK